MPDPLVLKKYSNRRLYDTRNSRYVTLEDVAAIIRGGEQVQIQDASTGEDMTAFILTQIVLEAAKRKNSLLPVSVLHLIIRFGDNALDEFFEKYFHKTLQTYLATKNAFDQQFGQWLEMGMSLSRQMPDMMSGTTLLDSMMETLGFSAPSTSNRPAAPSPEADRERENGSDT